MDVRVAAGLGLSKKLGRVGCSLQHCTHALAGGRHRGERRRNQAHDVDDGARNELIASPSILGTETKSATVREGICMCSMGVVMRSAKLAEVVKGWHGRQDARALCVATGFTSCLLGDGC